LSIDSAIAQVWSPLVPLAAARVTRLEQLAGHHDERSRKPMSEVKHSHHPNEDSNSDNLHHPHVPYWKRAHRDWRFYVAVCFMLLAMAIYVATNDLSWRPRVQLKQVVSAAVGR
jgi:hypothetical protein